MNSNRTANLSCRLAALVLLGWVTASPAQMGGVGGFGGAGGAGGGAGVGGGAGGAGGAAGGAGGGAAGSTAFQSGQALQGGLGALGSNQGGGTTDFTRQLTPGSSSSVGSTSFMGPYFINPLSIGIPTTSNATGSSGGMGSGKPTFGQPLYNVSQSAMGGGAGGIGGGQFGSTSGMSNFGSRQSTAFGSSSTATSARGGGLQSRTSGIGGSTLGGNRSGFGAIGGGSTFGAAGGFGAVGGGSLSNAAGPRAVAYQTTLTGPIQIPTPTRIRADLQDVLTRSASLPSRAGIQAMMEGDSVVLRGTVGSADERQLAEAMARLTPGVFDLRNELQVRETAPKTESP